VMRGNATEENTPHFALRMEAELNGETLVTGTSLHYRVIMQDIAMWYLQLSP
jgi:hypothetical protein